MRLTTSDLSIRQKLARIVFVTCGAAILLACSIFAVYDMASFQSSLKSELATLAEITASNTTAALSFSDADSARETLASLSSQKHIAKACIYARDGSILASYVRDDSGGAVAFPKAEADREEIRSGRLVLFRQIRLNNELIGTIYLQSDVDGLYSSVTRSVEILLIVILVSFATAYFLSSSLNAPSPGRFSSWLARHSLFPSTRITRFAPQRGARTKSDSSLIASTK